MEAVKTVFVNFAVCTFITGLLGAVLPNRSKSFFRILAASAVMLTLASGVLSLSGKGLDFNEMNIGADYSGNNGLLHSANLLEKELYKNAVNTLTALGVDEYEIRIETNTDESEMSVTVTALNIEVDEKYKEKIPEIKKIFENDYGEVLSVEVKKNG